MRIYIINVILNYKRILYTKMAYINYFISSLNIYIDKTPVPSSDILFIYLFINKRLYYNSSLSLNKSINLTTIRL